MLSPEVVAALRQKSENSDWSKHSFNCSKCPKEKCPAWQDITWLAVDPTSGVQKELPLKGCSFVLNPIMLADVAYQSFRTRHSIVEKAAEISNIISIRLLKAVKILGGQKHLPEVPVNEIGQKEVRRLDGVV